MLFHSFLCTSSLVPGHAKLVFQLSPLLRLLPLSCSHDALLLSCAWQAGVKVQPGVKVHGSARLLLDYLSHLSSPQLLTGEGVRV